MPAASRILAFDILRRVESGAWASDLLLAHSAGIDSRDAGLASEIVFGTLRYRAQLDFLIEHYSGRRQKPVSYTHLDVYKRQIQFYGGGIEFSNGRKS